MNVKTKDTQTDYVAIIDGLPGLGYTEDDIRAQLTETAKSAIQQIIDTLEHQYRKRHDLNVLPKTIWAPLRANACLTCAMYCEELALDLNEAANDPNLKL